MNLISKNDLIFVAGHTGMVGGSIVRCLRRNSYKKLLLPSRKELDLSNNNSVESWFCENKPDVVILAQLKLRYTANNIYLEILS